MAQAPAQPADQARPASDPFAYNPTSDAELSAAAGFEPVQKVTARMNQPQTSAEPQPTMADIPDPMAPAAPAPQPAQSGLFAGIPDPTQPAAPMVENDQAAEVASLDNALNNPDFTSVFAPIDPQASRKKMAKQAGVEPVILMEHVTKIYPAQPNKPALDDINIEIYPGEFVFLVGHSGSGKTTLLSTLNRDVRPTSGRILVAGQDLMKIKNRKVPFLRRQIGAVFQDFKLLPQKTAYENVAFALQCIGKPKGVIRSQVPEVLRLVGLADQMDSLPDQLSGGEQQRVAVARAMVNRPPLLICDEPTGNLDPAISLGIMKLLERINRTGTTVIVATHDREMVDSMHRRVIALEGGHVIRDQERGGYGNYGTN
ncbi:MAG: cell division ATP-binding protein FtsE [Collinsella sp.]|nr:cell division ATP-binding protein FtsE [Collinsella sp.]